MWSQYKHYEKSERTEESLVVVTTDAFKRALANLAGGVVLVTTLDDQEEASGMTATAVCSISVDPPLVMVCMNHATATHRAVHASGIFAINFLAVGAESLARRFASNRPDKFQGLETTVAQTGAPIIDMALAHCDCTVEQAVTAGDHTIFIGRVLEAHAKPRNDLPLLYFRGDYGSVTSIPQNSGAGKEKDA